MNTLSVYGLDDHELQMWQDSRQQQWRMHRAMIADWQAMVDAAERDGIALAVLSSYRSFGRQLTIWNEKCAGIRRVHDDTNVTLNRDDYDEWTWCQKVLRFSALPGLSRHHWGSELDVFDGNALRNGVFPQLHQDEFCAGGPCADLNQWLSQHCGEFGFYRPYVSANNGVAPEPWHLSYAAIADKAVNLIDANTLAGYLRQHDLLAKETVLKHLPDIVNCYALRVDPSHL